MRRGRLRQGLLRCILFLNNNSDKKKKKNVRLNDSDNKKKMKKNVGETRIGARRRRGGVGWGGVGWGGGEGGWGGAHCNLTSTAWQNEDANPSRGVATELESARGEGGGGARQAWHGSVKTQPTRKQHTRARTHTRTKTTKARAQHATAVHLDNQKAPFEKAPLGCLFVVTGADRQPLK